MTINSRYRRSSTAKTRSVKIAWVIIFGLAVLAEMTMSRARTDAFARMSNSGTASRSGKTARWRLAGGGAPPMAFNKMLARLWLVVKFASGFCKRRRQNHCCRNNIHRCQFVFVLERHPNDLFLVLVLRGLVRIPSLY